MKSGMWNVEAEWNQPEEHWLTLSKTAKEHKM